MLGGREEAAVDRLTASIVTVGAATVNDVSRTTAVGGRCGGDEDVGSSADRVVAVRRGTKSHDLGAAAADTEGIVRVPRDAGQPAEDVLETAAETDRSKQ